MKEATRRRLIGDGGVPGAASVMSLRLGFRLFLGNLGDVLVAWGKYGGWNKFAEAF